MRAVFAIIAGLALTACGPDRVEAPSAPAAPNTASDTVSGKASELPPPPSVPDPADVPDRIQDIDFTSYSRDMARFIGLEVSENKGSAKDKIQSYFQPEKGAEGNAEYNFVELGGVGATVMIASATGLADDSLKAQELFAVFKDDTLVDYGMKIKCWRGETPDLWQTTPCA